MIIQNSFNISYCKSRLRVRIPTPSRKKLKIYTGFTLIEALVAMAVLLIGVLGVIQLFPAGLNSSKTSKEETMAANLVQGELEQYKNTEYDSIISIARTKYTSNQSDPNYKFDKQVDVIYVNSDLTQSTSDTGLKKITVIIYWQEKNQEKNVSATLLKHK